MTRKSALRVGRSVWGSAAMLPLCFASVLFAADEHKAETKKDAGHQEAPKQGAQKQASKPEPAKPAAAAKPSALVPTPIRRPTPRPATRSVPRRATASVAPAPVAPPPIVVEVKQEPARVEAILHVVPYPMSPFSAPSSSANRVPMSAYPASGAAAESPGDPVETTVAAFAPAAFIAAPRQDPPLEPAPRNTLRAPRNALTNEGLVILAEAGYDEDFILELMRVKNPSFDTSVEGLAFLARHGLTERIIRAALQADTGSLAATRR